MNQNNRRILTGFSRILVTGENGFIAKNLITTLKQYDGVTIITTSRKDNEDIILSKIRNIDAVVHLAGENRPEDPSLFFQNNTRLTEILCNMLEAECKRMSKKIPIIYSSSTQVEIENDYGASKLMSEKAIEEYAKKTSSAGIIFRLPSVFGKWSKPNYNSVVATFCHNIARDLPIEIHEPNKLLQLVYIDDVIRSFLDVELNDGSFGFRNIDPKYEISLSDLAKQIQDFRNCRTSLLSEPVGTGLIRCLYSTFLSFFPVERFHYRIPNHSDPRGSFVEILKTQNAGQFSFFTSKPGVIRGGHYHHTKSEKFLVVRGSARFRFRNLMTNQLYELDVDDHDPTIVDTIPGWSHDVVNTGHEDLIVFLWANEVFDRDNPDTYQSKVTL